MCVLTSSRWQWSVVDSPILFNCKGNHVNEEDLDHVIRDEDIDISKVGYSPVLEQKPNS